MLIFSICLNVIFIIASIILFLVYKDLIKELSQWIDKSRLFHESTPEIYAKWHMFKMDYDKNKGCEAPDTFTVSARQEPVKPWPKHKNKKRSKRKSK